MPMDLLIRNVRVRNVCLFLRVKLDDWRILFKDEAVYCPMCGHSAPAKSFWTMEQVENAKKQAFKFLKGKIGVALKEGMGKA
jgi:hypothetical protein